MKLHQLGWQRKIGLHIAPILSKIIHATHTTGFVRKMIAFQNYLIGRGAGTSWHLEAEVVSALKCVHRPEPVIFDVGANVGKWSKTFLNYNSGAFIFLFEPQPACQRQILELNLPNSKLIPCAAGSEDGIQKLYSSSEFDGSASLSERQETYFEENHYESSDVNVIRLDDFIENENIGFVDFIKFDIEGHEFGALSGLRKMLDRQSIGAFSFEFGSGNLNSRTCFRDFWNMISDAYNISIITPAGYMEPISSYYEDLEYYRGVSNYIAELKDHPYR